MIEGLKLTMTGEELGRRLAERIKDHERAAAHFKREAKRKPDARKDEEPALSEQMCEYEVQLHTWRAQVLAYIREHIEGGETYRLGEGDLEFGEILSQKPPLVAQEDYEFEQMWPMPSAKG